MSYFYLKELNNSKETLQFQYPENNISKRQIEKKIHGVANSMKKKEDEKNDDIQVSTLYYEVTLPNNKPNFNFSLLQPTSFTARKFYFHNLIHDNIANVSDTNKAIVGEFIVEHAPKVAVNQRIYSCYLLEQSNNTDNDIDSLISYISEKNNDEENVTFDLQSLVRNQKQCIHYVDAYNHIFIFLETIPVNAKSAEFLQSLSYETNLFEKFSLADKRIIDLHKEMKPVKVEEEKKNKDNMESFIGYILGDSNKEGMDNADNDDEIYIDCQPVNESDESEVGYTKRLMKGKDSQNEQANNIFQLVNGLFIFLFIAFFVRMSIPLAYKLAIIKSILSWKINEGAQGSFNKNGEYAGEQNTFFKYIRVADYWLVTILLLYIARYFIVGTYPTRKMFTIVAVFLMIFGIFCYSTIQNYKKDLSWLNISLEKGNVPLNYESMNENEVGKNFFQEFATFPFTLIYKIFGRPMYWAIYALYFIVLFIALSLFDVKDRGFIITEFFIFNSILLTPFTYLMGATSGISKQNNKND